MASSLSVFAKILWLPGCHRKGSIQSVSFCKNILAYYLSQEGFSKRLSIFAKISWLLTCHRKGLSCGLSVFCKNIMACHRFLQKYHGLAQVFAKISWFPACQSEGGRSSQVSWRRHTSTMVSSMR